MDSKSTHESAHHGRVLPNSLSGGPKGLGDPNDRSLRSVEENVLIPQKMRKRAREVECAEISANFGLCAKEQGLLMPFLCRKENKALQNCLVEQFENAEFRKMCTDEYLAERAHYRLTGIKLKQARKDSPTYNK